jgi:hypothetical protein
MHLVRQRQDQRFLRLTQPVLNWTPEIHRPDHQFR